MKKIFILFLLVGYCSRAHSQILIALLFGEKLNSGKLEFGLVVSPVFTTLTETEGDYRSGLNLGLFFNVRPDKKFFLHAELTAKSAIGAKNLKPYSLGNDSLDHFFQAGTVERTIKTMNMILLGRYTISSHFFLDAGVQTDLLYKARDVFETTYNENDLQYTLKLDDRFTRLDFQLATGLFYKFKAAKNSMGIGVRYNRGVTDIDKIAAGLQANNSWQVNLNIPIGAAPKQKPAQ
ncbi:MAG: outer membrane beta-barrel protein [Flavisolibacter sp.]